MEFNATFLIAGISFIIFTFLMNLILYKPLENIVKEREELINGNYDNANSSKEKAKSLLDIVAQKLAKSKNEAKSVLQSHKQQAEAEVSKILTDAKNSNNDFIAEQKSRLQKESEPRWENKERICWQMEKPAFQPY